MLLPKLVVGYCFKSFGLLGAELPIAGEYDLAYRRRFQQFVDDESNKWRDVDFELQEAVRSLVETLFAKQLEREKTFTLFMLQVWIAQMVDAPMQPVEVLLK